MNEISILQKRIHRCTHTPTDSAAQAQSKRDTAFLFPPASDGTGKWGTLSVFLYQFSDFGCK